MQTKSERSGSPFGGLFDDAKVIHRYTRQNLVDDGFLVEVMGKRDLTSARTVWINEANSDEERAAWEASDFLKYVDFQGKFAAKIISARPAAHVRHEPCGGD